MMLELEYAVDAAAEVNPAFFYIPAEQHQTPPTPPSLYLQEMAAVLLSSTYCNSAHCPPLAHKNRTALLKSVQVVKLQPTFTVEGYSTAFIQFD